MSTAYPTNKDMLGIVLFVSYTPQALVKTQFLPPEESVKYPLWAAALAIFTIFYVWLPFTCLKLWKSASKYSEGIKLFLYKARAVVVGIPLLLLGVVFIFNASEIVGLYASM